MKKVLLVIGSLLMSLSAMASTDLSHDLGNAIQNVTQNHASTGVKASYSLIYGGQDIARPLVATADRPISIHQNANIG